MSLLDKASLVVTPNAYKESKLYSVIPSDGSGDMTVVRATTATRINSAGLIESVAINIPRIDYTNGSCPSLLVEPQRTNLQLNSEDFSNASWVKTLSAVVANQIASPSGNVDADKLNETATTGNHQLESSRNASIAAYSMSVFAKKSEREWLYLFEDTTGKGAYFNLNNGTIGTIAAGATAKIESFGNGWYRCSVTYNESGTFGRYRIAVTTGNGVTSYTGVANNGIYIWGAQYELGAYATSYIPTVASSVTRNADSISKTGISSLIGQTEGTAFIECTADTTNPNGAMLLYLGSSDGSGAFNYSTYLKFSSTSLNLAVYSGGTSYVDSTSSQTYTNKQNIKVAIAYKNNDFVCYANGVQLFIDTTGVVSTNLSTLSLGYYPPNIPYNQYNGNIKSVQLYKTRLTNAELAQLTTL